MGFAPEPRQPSSRKEIGGPIDGRQGGTTAARYIVDRQDDLRDRHRRSAVPSARQSESVAPTYRVACRPPTRVEEEPMVKLRVNARDQTFDGDPSMPLLWYLRDE